NREGLTLLTAKSSEVGHLTVLVQERMSRAVGGTTRADHHTGVVDGEGLTEGTAGETTEVAHGAVAIQKRVHAATGRRARFATSLPCRVDAVSNASRPSENAKIHHRAVCVKVGVRGTG